MADFTVVSGSSTVLGASDIAYINGFASKFKVAYSSEDGVITLTNKSTKAVYEFSAAAGAKLAFLNGAVTVGADGKVSLKKAAINPAITSVESFAPAAPTFVLTAGVDEINGTRANEKINTTAANLNAFDVINGGAGTDTLQIDDTATGATASFTGVTLSGIENLVLLSKLGLKSDALNVSSATDFPGLTSVKASVTDSTTTQTVTAATTTAVEVINAGTSQVTVVGGGNTAKVTALGNVLVGQATTPAATDANSYTSVAAKTATGTVDITDNSGTDGAVGSKLTSVSVTGTVGSVTGASTLTGKGITTVTLKDITGTATGTGTGGDVTITNATTGGHALTLGVNGITAGAGDMPVITDNTATSVTITSGAATAAATTNKFTLAGSEIKSLTIGGTKAVDLTSTLAKVTAVTITGSGGVSSDFSGDGASTTSGYVTSVSTAGSTAATSAANGTTANTITINAGTAFTGGAGVDKLTVASAANTAAIDLGAGDDSVTIAAASATTSGVINGGAGTDTLIMSNTIASGISSSTTNGKISNFEKLEISTISTTSNSNTAIAIDLGYLSNVNSYIKFNGIAYTGAAAGAALVSTQTINNLANNGTVEFAGNNTYANTGTGNSVVGSGVVVNVNDAAYGATDTLNLVLSATASGVRAAGSVTANGVETINISTSMTAATYANNLDTMTLAADAVKTIVVSGNQGLNLTNTDTTVTSVNASGLTGTDNAFTWTTGALAAVTDGSKATIVGSSKGINTINAANALKGVNISVGGTANTASNALTGSALADIIAGGAGDDTITGSGGLDTLTGNGGSDTFVIADGSGTSSSYVVITDFVRTATTGTNDKLSLTGTEAVGSDAITGWTVSSGVYTKAGATVADFFAAAAANFSANAVGVFESGGNTYVFYEGNTGTGSSDDVYIQLTGVTGITSLHASTAGANVLVI